MDVINNMRWRGRRIGRLAVAALVLAISYGCAGTGTMTARPVDREARLRERAAAYWEARVAGDLITAYQLHEPNFRKKVTLTAFAQGRGVSTVFDYEITAVRIEGDKGFVTTKVNYTITHPMLAKPVEPRWRDIEEQWRWVNGEWYRRFRFPMGDPYPEQTWWDPSSPGVTAAPPATTEPDKGHATPPTP
ncbi:MAG: hypothetical protein C3F08_05010 [Candidatus Methylomirabilota bacterium]|nr:MAG: hypothetical protein C3F08_05010 [candidate division NC10 bacterium]